MRFVLRYPPNGKCLSVIGTLTPQEALQAIEDLAAQARRNILTNRRENTDQNLTVDLDTPADWENPDWEDMGRVHEWKRYVDDELRGHWLTIAPEIRAMIARNASGIADREEYE